MSDLVLYTYFRSSSSQRVRIALHTKKLQFESKFINLIAEGGQHHSQDYKSLNPAEQVPTLVHGGKAISQSMAIIQYLDQVFLEKKLFPNDAFLKAKNIEFCEVINSNMQPFQNLKVMQYLEKNFGLTPPQKQQWLKDWMNPGFVAVEKLLSRFAGNFCFGDEITAADCFLAPQITSAERFSIDINPFPTLKRISDRYKDHEVFLKSHPYTQPDCPSELKVKA